MKTISNLIFAVAIVGMSGFWALALTGHLAPPPSAPAPAAQAPAQESTAAVAAPADKDTGTQKDKPVEAVNAPIEKVSAPVEEAAAPPAPAKKALASKSEKPRAKKPVQVKAKDKTAGDKS